MPLSRLVAWMKKPACRPIRKRTDNRARPWIEVLEDRCVPTAYNLVVNTNSDYYVPNAGSAGNAYAPLTGTVPSGLVSLRQAILIANNLAAPGSGNTAYISFSHTIESVGDLKPSQTQTEGGNYITTFTTLQETDLGRTGEIALDDFTTNSQPSATPPVYYPLFYTFTDPSGNSDLVQAADAPLPTIDADVVIDGSRIGANPMTIDAGYNPAIPAHGVGVFTVAAGATAEIENFKIQNADSNTTAIANDLSAGSSLVPEAIHPPVTSPSFDFFFFQASAGGTGGAVDNAGTVTILNDSFSTTYAEFGGALYNGSSATMTVENCQFSSNDAAADNELSEDEPPNQTPPLPGQGGAIYNAGTLTLGQTNSFNSDYAVSSGGAIYNAGTMNVGTSVGTFSVDQSFDGGAVYNSGALVGAMTNWTFTSCVGYHDGGAIYNSSTSLFSLAGASTSFATNNADADGGAIYNIGTGGLSVTAGSFSKNTAQQSGGAIYTTTPLTISNSSSSTVTSFSDNSALFQGGGIWNNANMSLDFATFTGLAASGSTGFDAASGGGVYTITGTDTISNATFTTNNAGGNPFGNGNGGGLYISSGNVTINSSTFNGNTATDPGSKDQEGGAIYINSGTVTINGTSTALGTFTKNNATNGGAIFLEGGSLTVNSDVNFGSSSSSGNVATDGGAIDQAGGTLAVQGASFTGNSATKSGGAIYISSATSATITGTGFGTGTANFGSNSAVNGGAIWTEANLSLISDVFGASTTGNLATGNGGALDVAGGTTTLQKDTFSTNTASAGKGGAIYNSATLNGTATSLLDNSAVSGGGLYNSGTAYLTNLTAADNNATNGGGFYTAAGTLSLVNDTVSFNGATNAGGGIYNASALKLLNTIVAENSAPLGPDIYQANNADANFVDKLYPLLLARSADPTGAASWIDLLSGGTSAATVVEGIEASTEYLQDQVSAFYLKYLGRAADSGGLAYWTNALANGATFEQVIDGLVSSTEYFADKGNNYSTFVGSLYTNILGRTGSPAEIAGWVSALTGGETRAQVAMGFLTSTEYRTDLVKQYYLTDLGRAADPAGLAYWVGQLAAGVPDQVVQADLIGSPEGFARLSAGAAPGTFPLLANNLIGDNANSGIAANVGNGNIVGTSSSPINPGYTSNNPASVNGSPPVLQLAAGSPAISAGNNIVLGAPYDLTTDETGAPRLQNANVDIGAVAFLPSTSVPNSFPIIGNASFTVTRNTTAQFSVNQVAAQTSIPVSVQAAVINNPNARFFMIVNSSNPNFGVASAGPGGYNLVISTKTPINVVFTFQFGFSFANNPSRLIGAIFATVTVTAGTGLVVPS